MPLLRRKHFQILELIMLKGGTETLCIQYNTKIDHVLSINYAHLCVISPKYLSIRIYLYHLHQLLLLLMVFQKGILHSHLPCFTTPDLQVGGKKLYIITNDGVGYRAEFQIQDFLFRAEERNSDIA